MPTNLSPASALHASAPSSAAELGYAEFVMVQEQLARLRALPESASPFRSPREQRLAELYNAFEHYTALADLVFEELQRELNEPIVGDAEAPDGDIDRGKLLAFPRRA
jgi:hypothetical protein